MEWNYVHAAASPHAEGTWKVRLLGRRLERNLHLNRSAPSGLLCSTKSPVLQKRPAPGSQRWAVGQWAPCPGRVWRWRPGKPSLRQALGGSPDSGTLVFTKH